MMTPNHKTLVFMVVGDDPRAFPVIHGLERLTRRDDIYLWFVRNGIVGEKFVEFVAERRGSLIRIRDEVLGKIDGVSPGPMLIGRDIA